MTYQGAIDELKSLENNSLMPEWFKPTIKKVRETMEMDGRENEKGEWLQCNIGEVRGEYVTDERDFYCSNCNHLIHVEIPSMILQYNFCRHCGADMQLEEEGD